MNKIDTSSQHDGLSDHSGELGVADMARYLSRLARLQQDDVTGNAELSRGLRLLSRALMSRSELTLSDVTRVIRRSQNIAETKRRPVPANGTVLSEQVRSMSIAEVERFLDDEYYSKNQLIELGFKRFGISRSKLSRLSKLQASESVRAALEHEKSLEAISREARGSKGKQRFSVATISGRQERRDGKLARGSETPETLVF